jgi:membrane-associated protease RseP (regulator of RpoE activity)
MDLLAIAGFLLFVLGLLVSIALHEMGHFIPAKLFGIKVTQYMVGFGRTVWSTRRGETEYGIKAIPLGGYVRMVGMLPPAPGEDPTRLRPVSTGPFQSMVENARRDAALEVSPQDADRVFYARPWWQKLVVMTGGIAMNLLLGALLFAVVLMGFGTSVPTTTVSAVSECIVEIDPDDPTATSGPLVCGPDDPATPAAAAGFETGDVIVAFEGQAVDSWDDLTALIRDNGGRTVDVVVERDGEQVVLTPMLAVSERNADPRDPCSATVPVGFLGVSPTFVPTRLGPGDVAAEVADFTGRTVEAVLGVPARMVGVWNAAFSGEERDICGPVGVVGAGRIGGDIASADEIPVSGRVAGFIALLASFNLAIAVFNLIPLLPLDGGHVAGALWEAVKRTAARVLGRPDPGPVDVAKALPLAYAAAAILVGMAVLLLYADIVNPVRLPG